jgi:hypothetical protein
MWRTPREANAAAIEAPSAMRRFLRRALALALALLSALGAGGAGAQSPAAVNGQVPVATAGAVSLSGAMTRVLLAPVAAGEPLDRRLRELGRAHRLFLVLGDLHADEPPGVVYELYLGLPPGVVPDANDPHYVGTLNFFAVAPSNKSPLPRSYDVTATVNALLAQGLSADELAVTIVAATGSPALNATPPSIGQVTLVAQ